MRGERQVHAEGAWHTAKVYERLALPVGADIPGPAILEQNDATVFMEPNSKATVDALGNLIIEPV